MRPFLRRRCVAPYPTRPTRPLERSHCRANPPRTVRVHCEHLLMWSECTGRTRRSGRSVYTGNPPRTVRERYARPVKLSVCTRPYMYASIRKMVRIFYLEFLFSNLSCKDNTTTHIFIHILIGMFNSNPMIPQYLKWVEYSQRYSQLC